MKTRIWRSSETLFGWHHYPLAPGQEFTYYPERPFDVCSQYIPRRWHTILRGRFDGDLLCPSCASIHVVRMDAATGPAPIGPSGDIDRGAKCSSCLSHYRTSRKGRE